MTKILPTPETLRDEALAALRETLGKAGELLQHQWVGQRRNNPSGPSYDLKHNVLIVKGSAEAHGKVWQLHVLIKSVVHPRQATLAILDLKKSPPQTSKGFPIYPLLIAPYISESVAKLCREAEIGYLDLAGNCDLDFGGLWFHVEGKQRRHQESNELKSLFYPKSARILRHLLQGPLKPWKVKELSEAASVSLGQVSKVRKKLLVRKFAVESEDGFLVNQPNELLDEWARSDDWQKRTETREYSLLENDPEKIASLLDRLLGEQSSAFTQWYGTFLRKPYTLPVMTTLYVEKFPDEVLLKKELHARRVDAGGGLRLIQPKDEGVFQCLQEIRNRNVVCDVQLYIDVIDAGLRGDEAAEELRKAEDFSGGWK